MYQLVYKCRQSDIEDAPVEYSLCMHGKFFLSSISCYK